MLPMDAEECEFLNQNCKGKPEDNMEVVPECPDGATLPVDEGKASEKMGKVPSKKGRCVSVFLKKFSRKQVVAPVKLKRPEDLPGTSKETAPITTEDVPENIENTVAQDAQKTTSETMETVEDRKCRCTPAQLKIIEQKRAMGSPEVMRPPVCNIPSPKTNVKNDKENATAASPVGKDNTSEFITKVEPKRFKRTQDIPEIKEVFCRKEEFEYHDEGTWEEYQSYFPHGVHVPESKHTMDSTMIESYVAQVGDSDTEDQHRDLDSAENFPDAREIQRWEKRKVIVVDPAVNTIYFRRPSSSSSSDEQYVPIKRKKRTKKRRCYY